MKKRDMRPDEEGWYWYTRNSNPKLRFKVFVEIYHGGLDLIVGVYDKSMLSLEYRRMDRSLPGWYVGVYMQSGHFSKMIKKERGRVKKKLGVIDARWDIFEKYEALDRMVK